MTNPHQGAGSLDNLDIHKWKKSENPPQLNAEKTEVSITGGDCANTQISNRPSLFCSITQHRRNLGVVFDQTLSSHKHVRSMAQTCFHHLRNISRIRPFLSAKNLEIVTHAFITSRLDYCNSLPSGTSKKK